MTFSPVSASLMSGNVVATRMKKRRLQRTQLLSRNVNSREMIDSMRGRRTARSSPAVMRRKTTSSATNTAAPAMAAMSVTRKLTGSARCQT